MTQQTSTFKISYDIDETSDHTIDAELLGQSIMSTAQLIKNTNKLLNGEDSELIVDVKAPAEGSVIVEFITLFNAAGINPLTTLGFVAGVVPAAATVLGALSQIRSRKVIRVEEVENDEVQLKLNDDNTIDLPSDIAKIVLNNEVRKSLEKIIKDPIHGASSGSVIIKNADNVDVMSIPVSNIEYFKRPTKITVDEVDETIEPKEIRFTKVNFDGVTGWQIKLPNDSLVSARMSDEAFIERINQNRQQFSKEALFSVSLKTTVTHKHGAAPSYKREVLNVRRHRANAEDRII